MGHQTTNEFKKEFHELALHCASIAVDAAFLGLWAAVEYVLHVFVLTRLELPGLLHWVRVAFELLFAVSTLAPIAIYIYKDVTVMFIRARRDILLESSGNGAGEKALAANRAANAD